MKKTFVFYVPNKSISLSHALLISMDIPSNLSSIVADSSGINRGSVNLLIHVSHLFQEEHIISIQLIFVSVNLLVVVLEQSALFFQMKAFYLSSFSSGRFISSLILFKSILKTPTTFPLAFALVSSLSSIICFLYSLSFFLI